MPTDHRAQLARIRRFDQLVKYLRDEMGWPIDSDDFEELTFEYTPEELGIDAKNAAKIQEIKRLRPLSPGQPWGIFFVKFERKRLPIVALRRILGQVALKKRASANKSERQAWAADDLLFVSNYGEGEERRISFAHFSKAPDGADLPTLKVLGWDNLDTPLHLDAVAEKLTSNLAWPDDPGDEAAWRHRWRVAFTLRPREVVTTAKELSERLAELARSVRDRINAALAIESSKGPLTKLMKAFQESLVHNLDAAGFADMYAQTIAYGLLSARISDPERPTADDFAAHMRTNPFLRELMETFLLVGGRRGRAGSPGIDFDELGVSEVVDLLDRANMEAVIRDFGDRNPQEDPVIHFYEHFLKEYDAKKRMQGGVFYTPRPVVSYIVRSVDELLRNEFGLEDGLADTTTWGEMAELHRDLRIPDRTSPDQAFVQILDPATGTGTFLVEVIDIIHRTMVAKWKTQGLGEKKIVSLWNEYVPEHLLRRLHAYELLMAPYAIAHLKVGLKLYETGYRFGSDERARIYLTNALEPAEDFSGTLAFAIPALAHEAEAVKAIKRDQLFTVVIGNPPYFGEAGRGGDWIAELMRGSEGQVKTTTQNYFEADGRSLSERNPKWLNDDYVKFIRLADWHIERANAGILAMITNHSYLDNPTFRGMRESLLHTFSFLYFYDLHGNARKKETSPDGSADKNVFEIEQGVAISLCAKVPDQTETAVLRADLFGDREKKYSAMMTQVASTTVSSALSPRSEFYLFVEDTAGSLEEYGSSWKITDAMPVSSAGMVTARDHLAIQDSAAEVEQVVEEFLGLCVEDARERFQLGKDSRDWKVALAQEDLRQSGPTKERIVPILYRPFDTRYTYYTGRSRGFVCMPRDGVMRHAIGRSNLGLITVRKAPPGAPCSYFMVSRLPVSNGVIRSDNQSIDTFFPLYLYPQESLALFEHSAEYNSQADGRAPNLSADFIADASGRIGLDFISDGRGDLSETFGPEDVFAVVYATFHSHTYRDRYADSLRIDFPRVPLPGNLACFRDLAGLGANLIDLHLLESQDLANFITTLAGTGAFRVEKVSYSDETVWLDKAKTQGIQGVPNEVWLFRVGGYQVCEKWLKDREAKGGKNARPGRLLTDQDIAHYQRIVVALKETIRIMAEIDEVIEAHGGWPRAFAGDPEGVGEEGLSLVAEEAEQYKP